MKSLNYLTLKGNLFVILITLLCFNQYSVYSQDITKVIPSSSSGVLTMDGENFLAKLDLPQILRLEMFQDMDSRTQGKRGKKYNEYSKIYKAPESIGLKLNAKWYLYTHHRANDTTQYGMPNTYTVITVPLISSKKLENFIKKITDSTIVKSSNYKYVVSGYNQIIIWNKQQVLLVWNNLWDDNNKQKLIEEFKYLTTLKSEEIIKVNNNFNLAQAQKFDFNYWMSYNSLFSGMGIFRYTNYYSALRSIPGFSEDFYKESYLHLNLNFNKGIIAFNAKQFMKPESVKQTEFLYGKGINPDFLKFLNKDHLLAVGGFSLNMKGIKSVLDTALHDTLKTSINEEFIESMYGSRANKLPEVKKIQAQLDSMYTELYTSEYDAIAPTDSISPYESEDEYSYDDYSNEYSDYADSIAVDTAAYTTDYTEEYEEDYYETQSIDTTIVIFDSNAIEKDSLSPAVPTYGSYQKRDSIYEAKNKRIDELTEKKSKLKKDYLAKKTKEYGLKPLEFLEYVEGDFLIACTGYKLVSKKYISYEYDEEEYKSKEVERTRSEPSPDIVAIMTLNNISKVDGLLKKLAKDTFLTKKDNYYFSTADDQKIYVAISGKLLLITNDELIVTKHINGFEDKNLVSQEIKDIMLNKQGAAYVNIREIFAKLPFETMSPSKKEQYTLLMNSFINSSVTVESFKNNVSDSQLQVNFTNKLDNSFYELLRIINEFYKIEKAKH